MPKLIPIDKVICTYNDLKKTMTVLEKVPITFNPEYIITTEPVQDAENKVYTIVKFQNSAKSLVFDCTQFELETLINNWNK
jgi:hypothetical protein